MALGYTGSIQNSLSGNPLSQTWGGLDFMSKAGSILGGLQGLAGLIGGIKQAKLAKDQFNHQKMQWEKTWEASKNAFNESLEARSHNRYNGTEASRRNYEKYKLN